jgi:hypothetical protein
VVVTLDSTFFIKTASSSTSRPLTQEELLQGHPNQRIFVLDPTDPKNPLTKKLQFFSKYEPLSYNRAIPVAIHNGIWHQLANPKNPILGEPYPVIHEHDLEEQAGKGRSIPNSEDNIHEDVQRALDQSIRQSPVALNAIILPRIGLLLEPQEMSATATTSTKTVGYIKSPVNQE